MDSIQISFPDGRTQDFPKGVTALEVAKTISEGLARNVLAAKVNGVVVDAFRPIQNDAGLQLLTWNDPEGKSTFWHSSAHLMAEALESLYPGIKFGIGPPIESGFYYDVDTGDRVLTAADLSVIEQKMMELARLNQAYMRREVGKGDALRYFSEKGDEYKLELIGELEDGSITFYEQGNFTDLCKGPHIPETGHIKAVKLTSLAGAYWRGDEKRKQLTRIYGITFPKAKELEEHLRLLEEARKRDHRKLGQELELFMFSDKVGAGLPIWLPRGTALRQRLEDFLKAEQIRRGYTPVITPHIAHTHLYKTSGHLEKYGEDSFQPISTPREGEEFFLKPMNCPHHCEIYAHKPRSYRDLPVRIAEFGTVYRYEQSGELHGLTRVRSFTQDDAHIFCTPDQVKGEFLNALDLTMMVIHKLGFDHFTAQISLRDPAHAEKYIGSEENWIKAEQAIIDAVKEAGLETTTVLGEAAFYGPKLDFMVRDALGRSWQLGTIQVDYNLPERFQLDYIGADNSRHRPVMIHRAPFGSMERFIGVLTEHCAGKFPLWLAPEQYAILPVSDKFLDYAESLLQQFEKASLRGNIDRRVESIGKKIRDAELKKVPFMLIVGEKERDQNTVSVRRQGEGDQGSMTAEAFINLIREGSI
ncbi:MAG: threonine--tRNA ligase [Saprospiraceae bacterium]|jgi:threonyl-tRNA synthetase|nr:threonine--tRNA ligase [Saprospiraceae bacterium]MBP9211083.1 threonine--tRNA ligase [Saprospiraceae bacterium]MBV6473989.1 Threonine--tRNA ligase [Saprospiraceae bacterium]